MAVPEVCAGCSWLCGAPALPVAAAAKPGVSASSNPVCRGRTGGPCYGGAARSRRAREELRCRAGGLRGLLMAMRRLHSACGGGH